MSTKETNNMGAASMTASDNPVPECPPGTVFNPQTGNCESGSGGQEASAFSDSTASSESAADE
jgi:hypothetical protein